ncbi:CocE/NonD family hydrolase [Streptomyces sp. SCSIO-PteL053]|nr:CocE/NonD family hydrolase [Streptomyces sp. SCSIO-PteL053]
MRGWAAHGFAALAQDVRGRHGSPGEWHPYRDHEKADGAATVAWVRSQAWSNGEVVAVGASYAAYCALVIALDAPGAAPGPVHRDGVPDAVIAAVPALGLTETARERGAGGGWARGLVGGHGDGATPTGTPGARAGRRPPAARTPSGRPPGGAAGRGCRA